MVCNTVLVGIVGTVMGVGGIVYGLPPEVLDQDPVASLPEADAVPPADAAAPTLIPVDFDFDPETLRVKVGSGLDQRLFQAAAGDLMTILPRGRAAGPALTSLAPDDQRRVRDEHGAQAEEWFATRFAEAAKSVLDRWRLDRPELRYSVVGVPIEGRGEQAETLNRHLAPLVESLDAIVSSKFLMVNADADPGQSALKSSMRNGAALAQGRPVYFRTPSGWSRFVPYDRA